MRFLGVLLSTLWLCACHGDNQAPAVTMPSQLWVAHGRDANGLNGRIAVIDIVTGSQVAEHAINTSYGNIAVDQEANELLAVDDTSSTVKVYALSGSDTPVLTRSITGYLPGYIGQVLPDPTRAQTVLMTVSSRYGGVYFDTFDRLSSGDAAPVRRLATGQQFAQAFAINADLAELVVVNGRTLGTPVVTATEAAVRVYALAASGHVAPLRTVTGDATGLIAPSAVVVDPGSDEIYVVDRDRNAVLVFSGNATGNTAPLRVMVGPDTGLVKPCAIVIDSYRQQVYVANAGSNAITAYPAGGAGNVVPVKVFSAPQVDIGAPTSMAIVMR